MEYIDESAEMVWSKFYSSMPIANNEDKNNNSIALKVGLVNLDWIKLLILSEDLEVKHHLSVLVHGSLGHGLGNFICYGEEEELSQAIEKIQLECKKLGGYAIVRHAPIKIRKKVQVWGEPTSIQALSKGIKQKIDQQNIMNINRFVGGI